MSRSVSAESASQYSVTLYRHADESDVEALRLVSYRSGFRDEASATRAARQMVSEHDAAHPEDSPMAAVSELRVVEELAPGVFDYEEARFRWVHADGTVEDWVWNPGRR